VSLVLPTHYYLEQVCRTVDTFSRVGYHPSSLSPGPMSRECPRWGYFMLPCPSPQGPVLSFTKAATHSDSHNNLTDIPTTMIHSEDGKVISPGRTHRFDTYSEQFLILMLFTDRKGTREHRLFLQVIDSRYLHLGMPKNAYR